MDRKRKIDLSDTYAKKEKETSVDVGTGNDVNPWTGYPYSAKYHSILATRVKLPVYQFKEKLIEVVKENQIVVVEGETGSGYVRSYFLHSLLHVFTPYRF